MLAVKWWREAMYKARGRHDPIALEVWHNGIYRTSTKRGVNQDLDARSCYDRIIPVATIYCRTLEKAKFH